MTTPSYFPRWTLREGGVVAPDERLPAAQTIALGVQHVVAMFGATVLAPLLMGFDPNVAIFFSGIGTLIFFAAVGGRVPSYLGSSFSFIAVVIAATAYAGSGPNANIAVALGGIVAAGAVYAVIGLIVMKVGYAWIETLMPPVVTGAVVAVIGLNPGTRSRSRASPAARSIRGSASRPIVAVGLGAGARARAAAAPCPFLVGAVAATCCYAVLANGMGTRQADRLRRGRSRSRGSDCRAFTAPQWNAQAIALIAPVAIVPRRREPGPRQGRRRDDGRESRPLSRTRVPGRRHRDDDRRVRAAAPVSRPYAENIGVMAVTRDLLHARVRGRGNHRDRARLLAEIRRADRHDSGTGAGGPRDCQYSASSPPPAHASGSSTTSTSGAPAISSRPPRP
jgi:hypothetical protein